MQRNHPVDRNEVFRLHMARLHVPGRVPDHRAGLRDAIAALTEDAAHPPPPAAPTPLTRALTAGLTPVQRQKDRLLCDAWDELAPDQRAALRIADALAGQSRTRFAGGRDLGCVGPTACLLAAILGLWAQRDGLWFAAWVGVCVGGLWWNEISTNRGIARLRARLQEADLKVALAMDHPGRYLEALEKLEAAELAGWELLRGEARMERPFSRRREHLYARLGFNRTEVAVSRASRP